VPETLIPALEELEQEYAKAKADPAFQVAVCTCQLQQQGCFVDFVWLCLGKAIHG
jgi:tryptophan synthase beta subunit